MPPQQGPVDPLDLPRDERLPTCKVDVLPGQPGSRAAGVAMAFKLIEAAQARWRAVNAPHLVALVRAGATFERGILVERPADTSPESGGDQQVA